MSSGNLFELAIIAFIILGIAAAIWRGGAQNPVGTGGLDKKLTALSSELKAINVTIGGEIAGVKGEVDDIKNRVEAIERDAVSASDIKRIEKAIERLAKVQADYESRSRALFDRQAEHAATSAETAATVRQIAKQVDLMMSVVIPKGMEK